LNESVPDKSPVALLLIDVINEFAFPEASALLRHAEPMARALQTLKRRARAAGVPIIYVNDNFGRWRSDFAAIVKRGAAEHRGARLHEPLLKADTRRSTQSAPRGLRMRRR
jgi:nicotinamidase-related amidase